MEATKPNGYGLIVLGGQERPYHTGVNQGDIFCRLRSMSLKDYSNLFSPANLAGENLLGGDIADFVYSSLVAGAEWDGLRVDFNSLHVRAWIDEAAADEVVKPLQAMLNQTVRRAEQAAQRAGNGPAPQPAKARGKSKKS